MTGPIHDNAPNTARSPQDRAKGLYNEGKACRDAGDAATAQVLWRDAIDRDPHNAQYQASLASLLSKAGALDAALPFWLKAHELEPGRADLANNLGAVLYRKKETRQALGYFEKAAMLRPGDAAYQKNIEQCLQDLKVDEPGPSGSPEPSVGQAHYDRGRLLERQAAPDYLGAAVEYLLAVQTEPTNAKFSYKLATTLHLKLQQPGEAESRYRQAAELEPTCPIWHNGLGMCLHALGQSKAGLEAVQQALALDPDNAMYKANVAALADACGAGAGSSGSARKPAASTVPPDARNASGKPPASGSGSNGPTGARDGSGKPPASGSESNGVFGSRDASGKPPASGGPFGARDASGKPSASRSSTLRTRPPTFEKSAGEAQEPEPADFVPGYAVKDDGIHAPRVASDDLPLNIHYRKQWFKLCMSNYRRGGGAELPAQIATDFLTPPPVGIFRREVAPRPDDSTYHAIIRYREEDCMCGPHTRLKVFARHMSRRAIRGWVHLWLRTFSTYMSPAAVLEFLRDLGAHDRKSMMPTEMAVLDAMGCAQKSAHFDNRNIAPKTLIDGLDFALRLPSPPVLLCHALLAKLKQDKAIYAQQLYSSASDAVTNRHYIERFSWWLEGDVSSSIKDLLRT